MKGIYLLGLLQIMRALQNATKWLNLKPWAEPTEMKSNTARRVEQLHNNICQVIAKYYIISYSCKQQLTMLVFWQIRM